MRIIADRYQITSPIGRGGMGEVWNATDLRLNRPVAVKLVRVPEDDLERDVRRRFHREARITARLRHPGVPVVYDFGQDDDLFIAMEALPGGSVAELLGEHGALSVPWATFIGTQVCAVLAAAHDAELLHRDVKPENLVLDPDGSVKVIDFGVATSTGDDFSKITQSGQIPGTAKYMAPELISGEDASRSSDLYTVGCLLYELLTGHRPFASENPVRELSRITSEPAPPLEDVPAELAALTAALLSKDPYQRPTDALTVYEGLRPWTCGLTPIPGWTTADLTRDPGHLYTKALATLG
jgi:non-specific serine/threonine protein kinase